ncbi:MAG: DUF4956 domain-containing protein [Planctomycetes bacterium]|nr:DUF4956 domain-containing protein [Planctomycetota bacterium]MCK5613278.1 DUF4956 domain-containing protein [Candidatus Pacearchaeota archaeon]
MGKLETFERFLTTQSIHVPVWDLIINLILTAIISFILCKIYVKYGKSLSNRKMFAGNFILIAMTTMLIITIVKSSLALSLGLVGALSIVRFRAAIKEPEELTYLFLNIAIGLGFGADQRLVTIIGFVIIAAVIVLKNHKDKVEDNKSLYLTVTSHNPRKISLEQIIETLKKHCSSIDLKRFDETKEILEAAFFVELDDFDKLIQGKDELQQINKDVRVTFLDNRGLV